MDSQAIVSITSDVDAMKTSLATSIDNQTRHDQQSTALLAYLRQLASVHRAFLLANASFSVVKDALEKRRCELKALPLPLKSLQMPDIICQPLCPDAKTAEALLDAVSDAASTAERDHTAKVARLAELDLATLDEDEWSSLARERDQAGFEARCLYDILVLGLETYEQTLGMSQGNIPFTMPSPPPLTSHTLTRANAIAQRLQDQLTQRPAFIKAALAKAARELEDARSGLHHGLK